MSVALDHEPENVPAPAVLERLPHVPEAVIEVLDLFHEDGVVAPRNRSEQ